MKYKTRPLKTAVIPNEQPLFSEGVTSIEIMDDAGGEYLKVSQCRYLESADEQSILIDPEEWPFIRQEISVMMGQIIGNQKTDKGVESMAKGRA